MLKSTSVSMPSAQSQPRNGSASVGVIASAVLGLGLVLILCSGTLSAAPPFEMSGELDVIIKEDFDHNHFEYDYFIRDDTGRDWYQLEFERTPPGHLKTGQKIRVRGEPKGKKFRVESLEEEGSAPSDPLAVPGDEAAVAVDEHKAVVLMVNLTNATVGQSPSQIIGNMFTNDRSVDKLYREASRGQMGFPADTDRDGQPDVFGPFNIPHDNSTCKYYDWAYATESAAEAAGVDLSLYRHRVFVLPNTSNLPACSWAGVANVGCGTFCRAWIAGSSGMIYAHELGHNLNMAHAGTDPENDGTINNVYGDYSDPMGGATSSWYLFNAGHMDQMGWYGGIPGAVTTLMGSGTYDIAAIGMDPWTSGAPAALKIYKPDTKDYYYLSYRQPIGDFNQLSTTYTKGVNVHRYKGSGYGYTTHVTTLTDGGLFTDSANGISVYQLGRSGDYARVQVSFGCAPLPPSVGLAPATLTRQPGSSVEFSVSVTDQGTGCGGGYYAIDGQGDLAASVTPSSLALSAGQTGSAKLVADAVGAPDGSYRIEAIVTHLDAEDPNRAETVASATLIVDGTAPSVPAGLAGSSDNKGAITLTWQAASDALSGVTSYDVARDGVFIGQTSTISFKDSGTVSGTTYQYSVSARDGAGNQSAASPRLSVTSSGKTTGKPRK
jgi:hypothetical protein